MPGRNKPLITRNGIPDPQAYNPQTGQWESFIGVSWGKTAGGLYVPIRVDDQGRQEVTLSGTVVELASVAMRLEPNSGWVEVYKGSNKGARYLDFAMAVPYGAGVALAGNLEVRVSMADNMIFSYAAAGPSYVYREMLEFKDWDGERDMSGRVLEKPIRLHGRNLLVEVRNTHSSNPTHPEARFSVRGLY